MKHLELIELIYKHRDIIDMAFRGEKVNELPLELVDEAALFQKVAKQYEISDSYMQFANAMLKRVDANYTFGDYNKEIKLLIRYKGDYIESKDKTILLRIKDLVRTLYKKIEQRDILINARVNDIVNDNQLNIEIVIKDAKEIDDRITELISAHVENLKILGKDLRGLDDELDDILIDIGIDMLPFAENIHMYNQRLSDFILRTEKRKRENIKLSSLSNKILKEADGEFKSLLLSNHQIYNHTLKERKSGFVKHIPTPVELKKSSFIDALFKAIKIDKQVKKAVNNKPYASSQSVEIKAVNLTLIVDDVKKTKPQNLYEYILNHSEIKKFDEESMTKSQAFKVYLTIIQDNREHIAIADEYHNNIRIVQWI